MMASIKTLLTVAAIIAFTSASPGADNDPTRKQIDVVASKLWETSGTLIPEPEIVLIDTDIDFDSLKTMIYYNPSDNRIYIGSGFTRMCLDIGVEALAIAIGHEMGHYFNTHRSTVSISGYYLTDTDNACLKELSPEERNNYSELETQADLFAAFHCYSAGYYISGIWEKLIDTIYSHGNNSLPRQSIEERKTTAHFALGKIRELEPVYTTAVLLYLTGEYEFAGSCFDFLISNNITSSDIILNAANAYTLAAINTDDEAKRFIYPFEIRSWYMFDSSYIKNVGSTNDRGLSRLRLDREDYRAMLISKALLKYNYLLTQDHCRNTEILTALSALYAFAGNFQTARSYLIRGEEIAKNDYQRNLVQLAKGMAYKSIAPEMAELELTKAASFPPARHNLNMIKNIVRTKNEKPLQVIRKNENFNGVDLVNIFQHCSVRDEYLFPKLDSLRYSMCILKDCSAYQISNKYGSSIFIKSAPEYKGRTLRDIGTGSSPASLEKKYGPPDNICFYGSSTYYIYESSKICFELKQERVVSWFLFLHQ